MKFLSFLFITLLVTRSAGVAGSEEPRFVQISPVAAVANMKLGKELKDLIWPAAEGVWFPSQEDALKGLAFIESPKGEAEIIDKAPRHTDMRPCLKRINQSRFQIFGFIINGRRHLLYDVVPATIASERSTPDLWLNESISLRVYDGGASFWSVLYDFERESVVSSGRRPD